MADCAVATEIYLTAYSLTLGDPIPAEAACLLRRDGLLAYAA
eukprot:COSAG02_NODE_56131_length_287_cov_0.643617_1_plen_41_part_01